MMILAIILSSAKLLIIIYRSVISCVHESSQDRYKFHNLIGGYCHVFLVLLLLWFSHRAKSKLFEYTSFFSEFLDRTCSDDNGLQYISYSIENKNFKRIFGVNFWIVWFTLMLELFSFSFADVLTNICCMRRRKRYQNI